MIKNRVGAKIYKHFQINLHSKSNLDRKQQNILPSIVVRGKGRGVERVFDWLLYPPLKCLVCNLFAKISLIEERQLSSWANYTRKRSSRQSECPSLLFLDKKEEFYQFLVIILMRIFARSGWKSTVTRQIAMTDVIDLCSVDGMENFQFHDLWKLLPANKTALRKLLKPNNSTKTHFN